MEVEDKFIRVSSLICEPVRARMLWNLLDGRAYTATELAVAAGISSSSASNHLARLMEAEIVKVDIQGRHRYYSFAREEVAYVIESMAILAGHTLHRQREKEPVMPGLKYCRTCYDHLAGFVAVEMLDAMLKKGYLRRAESHFAVTKKGWKWFADFGINETDFENSRRALTRQCLDWTERRHHLAGQLGAVLLDKMIEKKWFRRVQFSRELLITAKGRTEMHRLLGIVPEGS